ncbi:MAG: AprI/Inh family metalloprotease inhibitor [Rhizobiales bacterium]|nr:AprI/Inh family metalloprotease inhibitor [Hyphomicrobiales bacterium]
MSERGSFRPARALSLCALALGALLSADAGAATDRKLTIDQATGAWDMSLADTNRRCRLVLRGEAEGAAQALAMPAGCRRALPILAEAGGWRAGEDGRLRVVARDGGPVLEFSMQPAGDLLATGPEGETYTLSPADPAKRAQLAQTAAPVSAPPAAPVSAPPAAARPTPGFQLAQTPKPAPADAGKSAASVAGRYAVLREEGRDTGCMVTLDDKGRGVQGASKAVLAPACRDQGIVIFDPAGWRFDKGRLVLIARKGHSATFDLQANGAWLKDPKEGGKALGLKKL